MKLELEDLLLVTDATETLPDLHQHLPEGVRLRAAKVNLTLGAYLARGGFGELNANPFRHEVLGLTYLSENGPVEAGGIVVKNVSGYDLTRLVIGSGVNAFQSANLRLRPEKASQVYRTTDRLDFQILKAQGWTFSWRTSAHTYVEGDLPCPAGFEPIDFCMDVPTEDVRGPLNLKPEQNDLTRKVLGVLGLQEA
ncbi:FAD-binding oxidoreductase [Deinococcus misasensis]|uniref:FAD-binding oxidoreductase n=1 Tax=Deinococcus misasensis TaxID=392413 RepID=UPI00069008CA|nr:FAD-binding oxidoreductase [Deinococcus misasensis]